MKEEKKNWHSIYLILIFFMIGIMFIPYLDYLEVLPSKISNSQLVRRLSTGWAIYLYKLFYILMVPLLTSLLFSIKIATTMKEGEQKTYKIYYWIISVFVFIGIVLHPYFVYYNFVFLPLLLLAHLFIASRGFSKIAVELTDEDNRIGFNKEPLEEMGLVYDVIDQNGKEHKLHVNNVFQGMLVTGGAGAGKSASIIDPAIFQWAQLGCSMTIYDYKGNPATLGLTAYNSLNHMKKNPEKFNALNDEREKKGLPRLLVPKFEIVSFDQLEKTSRPNPLSPKTLRSSLDTKAITQTFMMGLNKGFIKNQDFWAQAAFALAHGIGERLRRNYPKYCTIAHLIVLGLLDTKVLVEWLCRVYEVNAIMSSYKTAIINNAEGQIGGMFSSFQQPLTPLMDKSIFWVLGAPYSEQSDLNLNDPLNPRITSFANDPKKDAALSPVLSCLLATVMSNVNEQGKHHHAFVVDEYPTIYLDISKLPATARSNKVATLAAFQDKAQTESEYGKEVSQKLISNLGSQWYGMTNLQENAEPISKMIGQAKKVDKSYSISDDGINYSTRMSNETTIQVPDIMSQSTGHFTGKIAGGKPAFFHCQFKYFNIKKEIEWSDEIEINTYSPLLKSIHEKNPLLAKKMFDTLVTVNYERIKTECSMILSGAIAEEEYID